MGQGRCQTMVTVRTISPTLVPKPSSTNKARGRTTPHHSTPLHSTPLHSTPYALRHPPHHPTPPHTTPPPLTTPPPHRTIPNHATPQKHHNSTRPQKYPHPHRHTDTRPLRHRDTQEHQARTCLHPSLWLFKDSFLDLSQGAFSGRQGLGSRELCFCYGCLDN